MIAWGTPKVKSSAKMNFWSSAFPSVSWISKVVKPAGMDHAEELVLVVDGPVAAETHQRPVDEELDLAEVTLDPASRAVQDAGGGHDPTIGAVAGDVAIDACGVVAVG